MSDYTEHLISMAGGDGDVHVEGRALVANIHERKRKADMLDQIQARADAATEGPWKVEHDNADDYEAGINYGDYPNAIVGPGNVSLTAEQLGRPFWQDYKNRVSEVSEMSSDDASFIAHARTDVPALLALVREQEAKVERAEAVAEWVKDHYGDYISLEIEARIRAALTATEGA